MIQLIDIKDMKNSLFAFDLFDILKALQNVGESLHWSILYLWATGNLGEGKSIVEFEDSIQNSARGFQLDWDELLELSKKFDDVIEGVFIGCVDKLYLKKFETDEEMYLSCDIVIEANDSAFWRVVSTDERVIHQLSNIFHDTNIQVVQSDE